MQLRAALDISDGGVDAVIHAQPTDCGLSFDIGTADHCASVIAAWNRRPTPAAADLHQQIMNLPCKSPQTHSGYMSAYNAGHRDARHAAAQLVAASPAAAAGVPTQQKENSNEGSTAQAPALGVDVAGSIRAEQGDGQMESQAHAAEGAKAVARLNWLHSPGSHNVDGWEWGIYRVRWIAGNTAEVLQTGSDFSDLDLAMGASPVAPVGAPTRQHSVHLAASASSVPTAAPLLSLPASDGSALPRNTFVRDHALLRPARLDRCKPCAWREKACHESCELTTAAQPEPTVLRFSADALASAIREMVKAEIRADGEIYSMHETAMRQQLYALERQLEGQK